MSDRTLTTELLARLQRHYIKPGELMPGGMFLPEVTLHGRRADALYVGFFASRGKLLVGHELKVSRADWLHELDHPEKAEVWAQHCHAWYLVVPNEAIVRREELPHGWGLMVPSARTKTRMDIVVKAAVDIARTPSWEATHALVQRADSLRMDGIIAAREAARDDFSAEVEKRVAAWTAIQPEGLETARRERAEALVAELSEILGFTITPEGMTWDTSHTTVEQLRHSFAHWLTADRATANMLRDYRLRQIEGAAKTLTEVAGTLAHLHLDVTGKAL